MTHTPTAPAEDRARALSRHAARLATDRLLDERASPAVREAAQASIAPWAERLVRWLDDLIRVPGTRFGIGLDPIIGFVLPGAGDAITGTGSIALLLLALKERIPTIVLLRMCMNILVDTIGGVIPFVGDAFDLVWRSNRRNLELIERYRGDATAAPEWKDYAIVALGITLAMASIAIPIFVVYGLGLGAILGLFEAIRS